MISAIAIYFHVFFVSFVVVVCVLVYWQIVCLFHVLICIMHSAFNLLVFPNSMYTPLLFFVFFIFIERAMCSPEKYYLEITIIIIIIIISKELHQIVNILSNRYPPKILPTIYPSADLPSIFIKHFT